MKLIVISNPTNLNNEHEVLRSLFEAGLQYYHLRKPNHSKEELEIFLEQIPQKYFNRIILHPHHDLAEKYNLKGKHLSSKTVELKGDQKYISTSFHSLEEIENSKENYDYVFLSPIFDSISKKDYRSNFDKKKLTYFFTQHTKTFDIIALGGINENTITDAFTYGFDGVAVLGGIWMSKNPTETFNRLWSVCKKYNKVKDEQST